MDKDERRYEEQTWEFKSIKMKMLLSIFLWEGREGKEIRFSLC